MPAKLSKQLNPMITIWIFSLLSAAAGYGLAIASTFDAYESTAYMATGLVHLIVLIPSLLMTRVSATTLVITSALCILFPLWGFFVGIPCVGTWATFMCSFIWGLFLMVSLRRPAAVVVMLFVGLTANLLSWGSESIRNADMLYEPFEHLGPSYAAWFMLMGVAMPIIMYTKPAPRYKGKDICRDCGYSLAGLDPSAVCPECGSPRANPPHTHGA